MIATELTLRLRAAAEYLTRVGWSHDEQRDDTGRVSIVGAVLDCADRTGDEHLVLQVLRARSRGEGWNKTVAIDEEDVFVYLSTATITEADLEAVFGPGWEAVCLLIREAAKLTPEQRLALGDALRERKGEHTRNVGLLFSTMAIEKATNAAVKAATDASKTGVDAEIYFSTEPSLAAHATSNAAWALSRRHTIGEYGFTEEQYDALLAPWELVVGPIGSLTTSPA